MKLTLAIATALLGMGLASSAQAFHPVNAYAKSANEGGGSGIYFTGSPRFKGYDCTMCHIDADGAISIEVDSQPTDLGLGSYTPGTIYVIDVRMIGEHLGGGSAVNENTFLAEFLDDGNQVVGQYAGINQEVFRLIDDDRVLATRALGGGEVDWRFEWRAPPAGTGPVTLYIAMLDGDSANDPNVARTDPLGDDVGTLQHRMCEGAGECAPLPEPEAGTSPATCSTAPEGSGASLWLILVALLLAIRPGHALIAGAVAVVALGSCFDPKTGSECPGRVCGIDVADAAPNADCDESWECTSWEAPMGSDEATRTCIDRNNRGTTNCKPDEGPTTLAALDMEFFKCRVAPILQRGCSMMNCHGTETGRRFRMYARGRLRNDEVVDRTGTCIPATGTVNLNQAGTGTVMCEGWLPHTPAEWKKNFDSARSFLIGVGDDVRQSDMLMQPVIGGRPHVDVHLFAESDPDYQTIKTWLEGATLGSSCNTGFN